MHIAVNTHGSEDTSKWITKHGSTAIKLHGQTIHLLPKDSNRKNGIEYYTHQNLDAADLLDCPPKIAELIDSNIYKIFSDEFAVHNRFANDCVNVGNFIRDLSVNDEDNEGVNDYLLQQMNTKSSRFDVGSISSINPTGNRVVVYVLKGKDNNLEYKTNSGLSHCMEPLGYPLFFTRGEDGWSWKLDRKIIDFRSYLCSKIFMPEKNINNEWIQLWNKPKTKLLKLNRFNIFCKLTQQYLCDMVSRLEDFQLKFLERQNNQLFGSNEIVESITENDFLGITDVTNINVMDNNNDNINNNINDIDDISNNVDNNIDINFMDNNDNINSNINNIDDISNNVDNNIVNIDEVHNNNNNNDNINSSYTEQTFGIFDNNNNIENEFDNVDDVDENNNNDEGDIDCDDGPTSRDKRKIYISDSVHGGRIHLRNISQNALSVLSEYGCPTGFLTLTTNVNWDEINENIFEDQDGYVRVDVTAKVFKGKLYNFIHNLKAGKYFGGRVPIYILFVFEWQERGLPHCHLVFRLTDHPKSTIECIEFIDKYIRTDLNVNLHDNKYSAKENEDYLKFVKKIMTHRYLNILYIYNYYCI